jgi:O-antigen/teichoic acid export membrane protein
MDWNLIKQIKGLKSISQIGAATAGGNAIAAIFWIYMADLMGQEDYGELGYMLSIAGIASTISILGGQWTMSVYTAKGVRIESSLYFISIITSTVSAIILYFLFENVGMSVYVISIVIFNLFTAEILGKKRYKTYSKIFFLQKIILVTLAILLYYILGAEGVLLAYGISYLVFTSRIISTLRNHEFNFGLLRQRFKFWMFNYIIQLSNSARAQIDILLIGPLFGFALVGNYFLGLQVLGLFLILPLIIFKYTLPQDSSGSSTKQIKIITVATSIGFALLGIFVAPEVIPLVLPEYTDTIELIPLLSLAIIPRTVTTMLMSGFLGKENNIHLLVGNLIAFSIIVSGILYLPEYFDIVGLAIAYVLSVTIQTIYLLIVYLRTAKTQNLNTNRV